MSIKIGKKDILEFGTTRVGKLFVWTSYSALLFAVFYILDFSPHQAGLLSLSLGLLILFPQFKFEILSLGVLLYLYPPFVLFSQRSGIYQSFDQFHLNGTYWRMVFFFLTALSGALLCMGFRWLISTFSPRSPLRKYAFFIALVLFFAVVDLAPWQSLSQSTYAAFWMLVLGASLSLPMLGYDLEALDLKKPMTGFRRLTFYFPIWRLYFIVPPKGESYLRETEAKSDFELSAVRWSGLGLLFWATTILMFVIVCRQSLT